MTMLPPEKVQHINTIFARQIDDDRRHGSHSMFLAIVPASGDVRPNTNQAMRFIERHKLQERTLGVFTKTDQVADPDVLNSLIRHVRTSEGESPEALGAVKLKSWVACMLKPPTSEEFRTHNFERLFAQRRAEAEFFGGVDPVLNRLKSDGLAGVGPLADRLTAMYYSYLRTTWKDTALNAISEKLSALALRLAMLGVPKPNERDDISRAELERRLRPGVEQYRKTYFSECVDLLAPELRTYIKNAVCKKSLPTEGLLTHLLEAKRGATAIIERAVMQSRSWWAKALRELLSAGNVASLKYNIWNREVWEVVLRVTDGFEVTVITGCSTKADLVQRLQTSPVLQICNFPSYMDKIIGQCEAEVAQCFASVSEDADRLLCRALDIVESPYLRFKPNGPEQVVPTFDVEGFVNTMVTLFMAQLPTSASLLNATRATTVGDEVEDAARKVAFVAEEIEKLDLAKGAICRALQPPSVGALPRVAAVPPPPPPLPPPPPGTPPP